MPFSHQSSLVNPQSELISVWQDPIYEISEDHEKTRPGSLAQSRKDSICDLGLASNNIYVTQLLKPLDRAYIKDRTAFGGGESNFRIYFTI